MQSWKCTLQSDHIDVRWCRCHMRREGSLFLTVCGWVIHPSCSGISILRVVASLCASTLSWASFWSVSYVCSSDFHEKGRNRDCDVDFANPRVLERDLKPSALQKLEGQLEVADVLPKSDGESHYRSGLRAGDGDTERKIQTKCFHGNPTGNEDHFIHRKHCCSYCRTNHYRTNHYTTLLVDVMVTVGIVGLFW